MVNCEWTTEEIEATTDPEVEAKFPGGPDSLYQFTQDHLYIPKDEQKQPITGIVYIRMIVTAFGEIREPYIVTTTDKRLERYAMAFVKRMPDWIPASSGEKKVCSIVTLPLKFEIK